MGKKRVKKCGKVWKKGKKRGESGNSEDFFRTRKRWNAGWECVKTVRFFRVDQGSILRSSLTDGVYIYSMIFDRIHRK